MSLILFWRTLLFQTCSRHLPLHSIYDSRVKILEVEYDASKLCDLVWCLNLSLDRARCTHSQHPRFKSFGTCMLLHPQRFQDFGNQIFTSYLPLKRFIQFVRVQKVHTQGFATCIFLHILQFWHSWHSMAFAQFHFRFDTHNVAALGF